MIIYFLNGNSLEVEKYYKEKEYRDDIILKLNNLYYELYFFTQDALEYEMTNDGFFAFPGLIILNELSTEKIKKAVVELEKKGFFNKLSGSEKLQQEKRFIHNWYVNELSLFDMNKIEAINL